MHSLALLSSRFETVLSLTNAVFAFRSYRKNFILLNTLTVREDVLSERNLKYFKFYRLTTILGAFMRARHVSINLVIYVFTVFSENPISNKTKPYSVFSK